MAKAPSLDDLNTMFRNSLIIHKNKPYFVNRVEGTQRYNVLDLSDQRHKTLEASYTDLKAPGRCFGFVNAGGIVLYLTRMPVRRYKVGACGNENMGIHAVAGYGEDRSTIALDAVYNLTSPYVCDTIFNRYPSIVDAFHRVRNGEMIVAFDRQFAVDRKGDVYYKLVKVGKVVNPQTVYDIQFSDPYKFLITLLDNNYEKSIPTAE